MNQQAAGSVGAVTWTMINKGFLHGQHERHPGWRVTIFWWMDGTCVCAFFNEKSKNCDYMAGRIINDALSADVPIPVDVIHAATDKMAELKRAQ
jgi:hypothetical protein